MAKDEGVVVANVFPMIGVNTVIASRKPLSGNKGLFLIRNRLREKGAFHSPGEKKVAKFYTNISYAKSAIKTNHLICAEILSVAWLGDDLICLAAQRYDVYPYSFESPETGERCALNYHELLNKYPTTKSWNPKKIYLDLEKLQYDEVVWDKNYFGCRWGVERVV